MSRTSGIMLQLSVFNSMPKSTKKKPERGDPSPNYGIYRYLVVIVAKLDILDPKILFARIRYV